MFLIEILQVSQGLMTTIVNQTLENHFYAKLREVAKQ